MSPPRCWIPVLFLAASPAFAGWSMTQVTTTSGDRDGAGSPVEQRVWMDGDSAKVEMPESAVGLAEPGSYLLVQEGGRKTFLINPARKTYARFDAATMGEGMEAMSGSTFEVRIEDPRMVKEVEEPGGELLGRATTHYRFRTTYTVVTSMPMGMKTVMATNVVEDLWTARAIALGATSPAMAGMGGGEEARPELQQLAAQVKATVAGLPLKQVTVTETKSAAAKGGGVIGFMARRAGGVGAGTTTTTMVVRDLVETTLPASAFQVPAGYAETEIMQRGPAMPDLGEDGR